MTKISVSGGEEFFTRKYADPKIVCTLVPLFTSLSSQHWWSAWNLYDNPCKLGYSSRWTYVEEIYIKSFRKFEKTVAIKAKCFWKSYPPDYLINRA